MHSCSLPARFSALVLGLGLAALGLGSTPMAHAALRTVIPPPANRWEAENVFIIDKDTNSVFLNANALYIASLTPSFPNIRRPEDLVGKTDYDFYPPADAAKYQADEDAAALENADRSVRRRTLNRLLFPAPTRAFEEARQACPEAQPCSK